MQVTVKHRRLLSNITGKGQATNIEPVVNGVIIPLDGNKYGSGLSRTSLIDYLQ